MTKFCSGLGIKPKRMKIKIISILSVVVNKEELSAHVKLEANQYGEKWAMVLFLVNQVKPGEFQQNTTRNSAQKTFVPIWSLLFKNQSNRMIVFITMAFVCIG